MVCLILDDDTTKALDAAFPPPDGATVPVPRHVTLNFLGDVSALDRDTVESAISAALSDAGEDGDAGSADGTETISGVFGGLARFTAETDEDGNEGNGSLTPIVALFDSPGLDDIQDALEDALTAVGMPEPTHGFTAHSTLFRADLGDTATVAFPAPPAVKASFTQIALVWGDYADAANVTMFPVGGSGEGTPAAAPAPEETGQQAHVIKHTHAPGDPLKDEDENMGAKLAESDMPPPVAAVPAAPDPDAPAPAEEPSGRPPAVPGPLGRFECLLVTEGEPTDDGRIIKPGALRFRDPPLPFTFTLIDSGHADARLGGVLTAVTRDGDAIMGEGIYADNEDGYELKAAVDQGLLTWVSIDVGDDTVDIGLDADGTETMVLLDGLLMGACALPFAAQNTTWIRSVPGSEAPMSPDGPGGPSMLPLPALLASAGKVTLRSVPTDDWQYESLTASATVCACAGQDEGSERFGAPLYPEDDWFSVPPPEDLTPLTVLASGQAYFHASGNTCHIAIPGTCIKANDPMMDRDFSAFHKGLDGLSRGILTASGEQIQVGQVTLYGGHADVALSADAARRHYDETRSAILDVRAVWDSRNETLWCCGALRYRATKAEVQELRATGHVSIDYRLLLPDGSPGLPGQRGAKLRLIALPVIPVGGLPPIKAFAASGNLVSVILSDSSEFGPTGGSVTDKDWDGSASRFNDAQYQKAAAACDPADKGTVKSRCFLPHHEPDGTINRNGVHAAAQRVGALEGRSPDAVSAAKAHLRNHYRTDLDEDPPDSLGQPSQAMTADGLLLDLAKDMYGRRLDDEASALAGVHRQEVDRLGGKILTPR
jgi:2'-5' RNA ligase